MLMPNRAHAPDMPDRGARPRRGAALVFVLVFVVAMGALAMGSIFMASNSNLLAKSYDRERDLKFAAEAALAMGKSRVNQDPTILNLGAGKLDTALLVNYQLSDASGAALKGIKVNVYVGPSGSMSGQFGRFSSIVAEARDPRGNGFIRRLELTQESFAKFAYWSNDESNGSTIIFFNNGDELWGPVWSNDTIHIGSNGTPAAIFHDEVGTAMSVVGKSNGVFSKGVLEKQKPINLPSTASLVRLSTISKISGWDLPNATVASKSEASLRERIEFVAADLNGNADSASDRNEGFFRYYRANAGQDTAVRGDWPGTPASIPVASKVNFCGDWHIAPRDQHGKIRVKFYPASVHSQAWFQTEMSKGLQDSLGLAGSAADANALAESQLTTDQILAHVKARCYLAGDPHLVAIDRTTAITDPRTGLKYTLTDVRRGGEDTTFTPVGVFGAWFRDTTSTKSATITTARPWDAAYLFPLDRSFNSNAKGVLWTSGNVGVSGVVNGQVTLYANGTIVLLDDLRYANDPVKGVCADIVGLISDKDIVIADNALNDPPQVTVGKTPKYFSLDDTKDMYIHAVMMALGTSFRVENYASGPTDVNDCDTGTGKVNNGRGCIYLSGGIIQQARGAVGTSGGTGYTKRYSYDHCAVVNPPPYFPTTGRFQDNRYIELDPAGFDHLAYFKSITPDP